MQYSAGSVAVTNGNASIVGTGTLFLSNVSIGSVFSVKGSGVPYIVGAIPDDTHLTLTGNYAGPTLSGLAYAVTTSRTPNRGWPYPEAFDVDTATILKQAMVMLDAFVGATPGSIASANNLVLPPNSRYNQITGAVQINLIDNSSWIPGRVTTIKFNGAPTVKNNQTASGNFKPVRLVGSVDFVASALDNLSVIYDSVDACWYETGRVVI